MRVIDSHTGGESTRLIISGGPDLGSGPLSERRVIFEQSFDHMRRFAVCEPRGFDAMVGALLCEPHDPSAQAGLIFFNNVGYLGMCGHGTIGAAVTLHHMGVLSLGRHILETPVGLITVDLESISQVSFDNVASSRLHEHVELDVEGLGPISGEVAWGGNWFFLTKIPSLTLTRENIPHLTRQAMAIRAALKAASVTGENGAEIDHIEIFGRALSPQADSRSFVLCPGGEYDRSPCGTGTSAKLACLAADGRLGEGKNWVQESIIGSTFTASYRRLNQTQIIPRITGTAYVVSEARLIRRHDDPFRDGIT